MVKPILTTVEKKLVLKRLGRNHRLTTVTQLDRHPPNADQQARDAVRVLSVFSVVLGDAQGTRARPKPLSLLTRASYAAPSWVRFLAFDFHPLPPLPDRKSQTHRAGHMSATSQLAHAL